MKRLSKIICIFLSIAICIPAFAVEKVYFVHTDPAGTPLAMTNADGAIVWKAEYKPFGEIQSEIDFVSNNKKFVGKELDAESGLYYFGARYMEARIGRFVSPDPIGPVDAKTGGIKEIILLNPQRVNPYAYALNNPYKFIDTNGEMATEAGAVIGTFVTPGPGTVIGAGIGWIVDATIGFTFGYALYKGGEILYNEVTEPVIYRSGETPQTKKGREEHKRFDDRVKQKPGWQSQPQNLVDPATGNKVIPDAVTPSGHPVELKPKTPSGIRAGEKALEKYERATGKNGKVIYY